MPRGLVDRLAQTARERARRAVQLAPDDVDAQVTYGDLEYWFAMPTEKHHGELGCWPSNAADAYERAASAGAAGATPRLAGLQASARHVRIFGDARIETCSGEPDRRLDAELMKATVEQGNSAWSSGIRRTGNAELYPSYFAGKWLDERNAEVDELRRNRQDRQTTLQQIEYADVAVTDATSGTVETVETWQDRTLAADGSVIRDVSGGCGSGTTCGRSTGNGRS